MIKRRVLFVKGGEGKVLFVEEEQKGQWVRIEDSRTPIPAFGGAPKADIVERVIRALRKEYGGEGIELSFSDEIQRFVTEQHLDVGGGGA